MTGSITLFHGTTPHGAARIMELGLIPNGDATFTSSWFMLTDSIEQARAYGDGTVVEFELPTPTDRQGGPYLWPGRPHHYCVDAIAYAPKITIPPAYIKRVEIADVT